MLIDLSVLGEAIKRLRGERSQRFVARRAKVPVPTWSQWENGRRQPRKEQLEKILRGLDCSLETLELEVWNVWTDRLRRRELEPVMAMDRELRGRIEEMWQLDFSPLPPGIEQAMIRIRRRIDGMWEIWVQHFEPLVGDFEMLTRILSRELTRRAAEHRDDDPSF